MDQKFSKNFKRPSPKSSQGRLRDLSIVLEEVIQTTTCLWNHNLLDILRTPDNKDNKSIEPVLTPANRTQATSCQAQDNRSVLKPEKAASTQQNSDKENEATSQIVN